MQFFWTFSLAEDIATLTPDQLYKCSKCTLLVHCPDVNKSAYPQAPFVSLVVQWSMVCPDLWSHAFCILRFYFGGGGALHLKLQGNLLRTEIRNIVSLVLWVSWRSRSSIWRAITYLHCMKKITIRNDKMNTVVTNLGCLIFSYFQLVPNQTVLLKTAWPSVNCCTKTRLQFCRMLPS